MVIKGSKVVVAREETVSKTQEGFARHRLDSFDVVATQGVQYEVASRCIIKDIFPDRRSECVIVAITRGSTRETMVIVVQMEG